MVEKMTDQLAERLRTDLEIVGQCKYLEEREVLDICQKCTAVFKLEPNVVKVATPVTVVGDIHGRNFVSNSELWSLLKVVMYYQASSTICLSSSESRVTFRSQTSCSLETTSTVDIFLSNVYRF